MKQVIISTQTKPQSSYAQGQLACPCLEVSYLAWDATIADGAAGVLTSRHAASDPSLPKTLPYYCVGAGTAHAARQNNLHVVAIGDAGVQSLQDQLPKDKTLYHFGAAILARPVANAHHIITYKTMPVTTIPDDVCLAMCDGQVAAVAFLSARGGAAWCDMMAQNATLARTLQGITALCLSTDVVKSVDKLTWKDVQVADNPDSDAFQKLINHYRQAKDLSHGKTIF